MCRLLTLPILLMSVFVYGQGNSIYERLPVGKYKVGFKIITLTDDTRLIKPEYNYLGEKNEGDRRRRVTIHIWYPASNGGKKLLYQDYCYNYLFQSTNDTINADRITNELNKIRRSTEQKFGKASDSDWEKLIKTSMLASPDAQFIKGKFPLLIGMLRPLSTSVINELLASNGYVVAMVKETGDGLVVGNIDDIQDMRFSLDWINKNMSIDDDKIGTFGFSGSGFSQVLFAMDDYRVKAVADLESGIYMDVLFQKFSSSNYYRPNQLRVPFLHIFSHDLSKQEKFIDEFENKTKFAKRYRLILNQPALHHWDFACEGYTSTIFLNNRGDQSDNICQSFEIASYYLLKFFNAELKKDAQSIVFLSSKSTIPQYSSSLWNIEILEPVKPAPTLNEFEYIISKKGIDEALAIARQTIKDDSSSDIMTWYYMNSLGSNFLNEKKYKEAIGIFQLNTELHPTDPNLFDSLAEGYEAAGDKEKMKEASNKVLELLNNNSSLTDSEKSLKQSAERRLNL